MKHNNSFKNIFSKRNIDLLIKRWSRLHTIILFFIVFFLLIIKQMFSYTVLNYSFYKWLAESQQIWKVTLPVNRWTIKSSWDNWIILGTSLNLYDIAIDPQVIWDLNLLNNFLVDIVYKEICENKSFSKCESNILKFLRLLEIEWFNNSEDFVKKFIKEKINSRISQTNVTSVFIDKELDSEQVNDIIMLWLSGLYPTNNYLYVNPEEFLNTDSNIKKLAKIIWTNEERLKYLTRKRELRYIPIFNKLSIDSSEYIKKYISEEKEAIRKWILLKEKSISWFFILTAKPNRFYSENDLASQVIGFVDNSWEWHYWIEWYFDNILKWNNWEIVSTIDVNGRIIDPISIDNTNIIWEWVQINTTIDRNIQSKVEKLLEKWVKQFRANKWSVIVMDPFSWDIIAMANYPSYDLNNYWDVYELEKVKYSKYPNPENDLLWMPIFTEDIENGEKFIYDNKEIYLRKVEREEFWDMSLVKYKYKNDFWAQVYKNDTISALYEPGSIMKSITVAVWIDTWEINQNSMYLDEWELTISDFTIKNVSDDCLWYHTFWHALNYSCNVWMIRIVQKLWKRLLYQYLEDFWFWQITWISLEWEVKTDLWDWEKWPVSWLLTRSYGLWISVTPLQMASAYSVLANGWIYVKPKIIDEIRYPDWKIVKYKTEEQRRVIKESTSKTVTNMLLDSTVNWVAKTWAVEWYSIAWKTWTAQIAYKWKYEKWAWWTIWSYAWYGPVEDPKFVIIVKLDRPRTSEYGWSTASYIFKDIATYLFDYYKIPKKQN